MSTYNGSDNLCYNNITEDTYRSAQYHIQNNSEECSVHSPETGFSPLDDAAFSSVILHAANRRRRYRQKPATSASRSTYRKKATTICANRRSLICCAARLSLALLKLTVMQGKGGRWWTGAAWALHRSGLMVCSREKWVVDMEQVGDMFTHTTAHQRDRADNSCHSP